MSKVKILFILFLSLGIIPIQAYNQVIDILEDMNERACDFVFSLADKNHTTSNTHEAGATNNKKKPVLIGSKNKKSPEEDESKKVYFKDIVGIDAVLAEVSEIAAYLKNTEKYQRLGARMPCGILLEGPPGCGKTMIARAIANEADCHFEQVSGASFIEEFVGVGAKRVRELFARARAHKRAIIFIDEFDAVAGVNRASLSGSGGDNEYKQTVNQLLTELDGFSTNDSIIVIAATNNAASLDSAVKRSGRFDRLVHVPLPDETARKKLLSHYLKKLPRLSNDISEVLYDQIADESEGLCAADFKNMVNEIAIEAVRQQSDEVLARHVRIGADKVISQRNVRFASEFQKFLKKK